MAESPNSIRQIVDLQSPIAQQLTIGRLSIGNALAGPHLDHRLCVSGPMRYDSGMRKPTIALAAAALAFAGLGLAASAQQNPAAAKSAANTVVVYKSPT
jgi:hypothetical protein